jgi:acyl-coenzyme A thioesterase PaaI-like protein
MIKELINQLPPKVKNTIFVRSFGLFKIPVIFFIGPIVEELNAQRCAIRIPLNYRTRNHLKSMYFGVLAAGADLAGGLIAMETIEKGGGDINLIFKDFKAEFLKRAEGDTVFICEQGQEIQALVEKARSTGERVEMPVHIAAKVPSQGDDDVARFTLTLSLKKRPSKKSH